MASYSTLKEISHTHKTIVIDIYKAISESFPNIEDSELAMHLKNCNGLKFHNFQSQNQEIVKSPKHNH